MLLRRSILVIAFTLPLAWLSTAAEPSKSPEFEITFDSKVTNVPFTGRVYVMLSSRERKEPAGLNWFNPEPTFALDVKDWKPGDTLTLDRKALGYPYPLVKLPAGTYYAMAILDRARGGRSFATAEGNGYSGPVRFEHKPDVAATIKLAIDNVCQARKFTESERVKLVDIESKLLTQFHGKPMQLRAGVVLPKSFQEELERRYPVVYEIPGFGGNHFAAAFRARQEVTNVAGEEMLWVVLDPECRLGHHAFADSENNGPCGKALVEELIPHIEQEYRGLGVSTARFVTGHSSGGWSSLWLQVTYPDTFGGVWSTAPDPVDFRDFQRINLYQPGVNMFTDEFGQPRPIARRGGKPVMFYKPFSDMEVVMGRGGQLGSFEAVFSPRGPDGKPRLLWNRETGLVDSAVAKHWQAYDIRLVLERSWKEIGPKLKGKLHVYTGSEDTFYLDVAVIYLKEALQRLGSDAVVEVFPGKDHGTLLTQSLRERIAKEMAEQYRKHHKD